jgi:hypothetical protein
MHDTTSETKTEQPISKWAIGAMVVLVAALVAALVWFALGINSFYVQVRARPLRHQEFGTSEIQSWMTFRYVDFVFHLPPGYLAGQLGIAGSSYTNETLGAYSATHGIPTAAFLQSVQSAVASYESSVTQ